MTQSYVAESSEGRTSTLGSFRTGPARRGSRDARCSHHEASRVSFWARRMLDLRVVQDSIAHRGLAGTLRKSAKRLNLVAPSTATVTSAASLEAVRAASALGLQPGEWVEVKSAEEIRDTLDRRGMVRGLYFMDEMWRYAGRRFKVLKRMERLMVERTGVMRTIRTLCCSRAPSVMARHMEGAMRHVSTCGVRCGFEESRDLRQTGAAA